ncbi:MAG: hypothetical protein ACRDRA_09685 [Pseudonocardiaceae bacterium]
MPGCAEESTPLWDAEAVAQAVQFPHLAPRTPVQNAHQVPGDRSLRIRVGVSKSAVSRCRIASASRGAPSCTSARR